MVSSTSRPIIFERPAVGKRPVIIFGMVKFLKRIFNSSETVFNLIDTVDFLIRRMYVQAMTEMTPMSWSIETGLIINGKLLIRA